MPCSAAASAILPTSGWSLQMSGPRLKVHGLAYLLEEPLVQASRCLALQPPTQTLTDVLVKGGVPPPPSPPRVGFLPAGWVLLAPPASRAFPPQVVAPPS